MCNIFNNVLTMSSTFLQNILVESMYLLAPKKKLEHTTIILLMHLVYYHTMSFPSVEFIFLQIPRGSLFQGPILSALDCISPTLFFKSTDQNRKQNIYKSLFITGKSVKVHIFWEGHKILRNLHQLFVLCTASQIIGGDFAKFCGLLRIYELY